MKIVGKDDVGILLGNKCWIIFHVTIILRYTKSRFWLSFFFSLVMYLILPVIFYFLQFRLVNKEPENYLLNNSWRILRVSFSGNCIKRYINNEFWESAKASNMIESGRVYYNMKKQLPFN